MTTPKLFFESVNILRMPGFENGGFEIKEFSPGVNVVYGPNASGKSSLGRALQKLLCPPLKPERLTLHGTLQLRGERLAIRYDIGHLTSQKNGHDVDFQSLAPADLADRNILALHDLISSMNGSDLAAEILKQSAGGYDIQSAKEKLGYRDSYSHKGKKFKALKAAIEQSKKAKNQEELLANQEKSTDGLIKQAKKAQEAQDELLWLEKAAKYHEEKSSYDRADEALDQYPENLAKLLGNEQEELEELRVRDEQLSQRKRNASKACDDAEKSLEDSPLKIDKESKEQVSSLRLKCVALNELSREREDKKRELRSTKKRVDSTSKTLGVYDQTKTIDAFNAEAIQEIVQLAHRGEQLYAEQVALDSMKDWLSPEEPTERNEHAIQEGVRLLNRWLALQTDHVGDRKSSKMAFTAALLTMTITGLLFALMFHLAWLLLLLGAAALAIWSFWPRRQWDEQSKLQKDYQNLPLEESLDWSSETVRHALYRLHQELSQAVVEKEKKQLWGGLDKKICHLKKERQKFDLEKYRWRDRFGVSFDGETIVLSVLADNWRRLQQAHEDYAAELEEEKSLAIQYQKLLDAINDQLVTMGMEQADDPHLLSARVEELDKLRDELEKADAVLRAAREEISKVDHEIEETRRKCEELFQRIGISEKDEEKLVEWCRKRPAYLKAVKAFESAKSILNHTEISLADRVDLKTLSVAQIQEQQQECRTDAEQLAEINREIGGVKREIQRAKESHDLEKALVEQGRAADELRQQREEDYRALVGNVLVAHVADQQRERARPAVFRRANELFVKFTHGRYKLDVVDGDPPQFRAFDTAEEIGKPLDHLSSGTRLQLLLAVRVAFVEQQERGTKLPLIFDETLGNSDERRAREIIEAAIEICRDGRQIFYFTAQHDEVGKWRSILAESKDIPHKEIDLAQVRKFNQTERVTPIVFQPPPQAEIPSPDKLDWLEYGRTLSVPKIEPRGETGAFHLWYLIDELPILYRLLKQDINRWGQLQNLVDHGGVESITRQSSVFLQANAAASAIEETIKFWRIGHGKPIDRMGLLNSNAVSDRFLDEVAQLALELESEGQALIEHLQRGEVKRFQKSNIIELQDYLLERGYIDDRATYTTTEILDKVRVSLFSELEKGYLTKHRLELLVSLVLDEIPCLASAIDSTLRGEKVSSKMGQSQGEE